MESNTDKKILDNILADVKLCFSFMNLNDSEFLSVIKANILDNVNDSYIIAKKVIKYYYSEIAHKLENDDFTLIYKYIDSIKAKDTINFIEDLSSFLSNLNIEITLEMYEKIFNGSFKLNSKLAKLLGKNEINQNTLSNLSSNGATQSLLEAYCIVNNINIDYNEELDYEDEDIKYDNSFVLYLKDMSKYPLLSYDEERELLVKYKKNNDMKAREMLINCNARLVVSIAKRYISSQIQIMDLVSEGNLGLMEAVDKFDITKPYKLATYATWLIRKTITRMIDNSDFIRIPVGKKQALYSYQRDKNSISTKLEKDVIGVGELSKHLNMPVSKIIEYEQLLKPILSISEEIHSNNVNGDGDVNEIEYFISDPDSEFEDKIIEKITFEDLIKTFFKYLNKKEIFVLMYKYSFFDSEDETYRKIAEELYSHNITSTLITLQGVKFIEKSALRKIRFYMTCKGIKSPFGKDFVISESDTNILRSKSNIYMYFYFCTKEQVDNALLLLTDMQFSKLLSYYGYDLDNPVIDKTLPKKDVLSIRNCIIPKISNILSKNISVEIPKNLYDYFGGLGFDKDKVDSVTLSNIDMELLHKYYDLNFKLVNPIMDISLVEKRKLYSIILNLKKLLEKKYKYIHNDELLNQYDTLGDEESSHVKKKVPKN